MRTKKITRNIIFILTFIFIFASCQSNDVEQQEKKENNDPETGTVEIDYYKNIPDGINFGGELFTFLTYDNASWPIYIEIDEFNGEILNDAAYQRTSEVSELLGVEFKTIKMAEPSMVSAIVKSNAAGDNSYDLVFFWAVTNPGTLIIQNQLYDWNNLSYVDTSAAWYNQSANDSFTVNGKQYLAVSDISYPIQQHWRYLFNKDMCKDFGLDYPYQLVYDGKWTHDAINEYIKNTYIDLNGDGKTDVNDQYGLAINSLHLARTVKAWGEMPVTITHNGFELNLFNNRIADMTDKLAALGADDNVWMTAGGSPFNDVFRHERALLGVFSSDPNVLRELDFDFGYLPYPKYNEQQKEYITPAGGGFMGVPGAKTDENIEFVGAVIEALSAASNKYIADAFVKSYFENKVLRDEDSVNMYHLIRRTSIYDSSQYFDTTGLLGEQLNYYGDIIAKNSNLASRYASVGEQIEIAFEKMYVSVLENQ